MNHELLLPALLELLAKSALLLLGAAALVAAARRFSAAQQHALWLAVFAALLALPLTKCIAPRWHLPGSPAAPVVTVLPALPEIVIDSAPAAPLPPPPPKTFHLPDPLHLAIGLWLAGAVAIVAYRLLGSLQIAWLRRRSVPSHGDRLVKLARQAAAEMHLRTPSPVRSSEAVRVPCTWGLWRPIVLLPTGAESEWPEARLLAALRHEFAHVARRDYLARWVALLTCALYWPNPLVWLAARRLRMAQEQACDDLVLRAGTPPADYAALLVEAARASLGAPMGLRAAVAMARPSTLEGRLLAIVDDTRNRHPAGRATSLAGALCMAAVIGASALAQIAPEKSPADTNQAAQPKDQILITAKFIELPKGKFPGVPYSDDAQMSGVLTEAQAVETFRKLETQKGVEVLSSPQMTINSGQAGSIQVGDDYDLPPGSQPPRKFVGSSVEVTSTATGDGIDLDLTVRLVTLREAANPATRTPTFDEKRNRFTVTIFDRSTVVMPLGPTKKEGRELYVFLTARKISAAHATTTTNHGGATAAGADPAQSATDTGLRDKPEDVFVRAFMAKVNSEKLEAAADYRGALAKMKTVAGMLDEISAGNPTWQPQIVAYRKKRTEEAIQRLKPKAAIQGWEISGPTLVRDDAAAATTATPPAPVESPALKKAQELILPKIEFREATLAEALDFLRAKATAADPEKKGVNLILKAEINPNARITLSLTNIPLIEAVRYVAGLANLELRVEPNALVFVPPAAGARVEAEPPGAPPAPPAPPALVPSASPALNKARTIIIPKLELREASLAEALDFLRTKAAELDPDKSGVNMVLDPHIESVALGNTTVPLADVRITTSLTSVPLDEALRYVTELAGLKLRAEPNALVLQAPPAATPGEPKPATPPGVAPIVVPAESEAFKKAGKIIFPRIETREATLDEMLDFLRAKAIELDPDKTGVNIVLQPGTESDARITVSLTNIPLTEALRYTAGLANLEVRAEPNALVLAPPAKAAAPPPVPAPAPAPAGGDALTKLPINLTADRTRLEGDIAIAEGNARFSGGPFTATADSVHYNTAQHSAHLAGKVEVHNSTTTMTGEDMELFLDGAGRITAHGPHKTTVNPPPAGPAPVPTTGQIAIPVFPKSKKPFANGDGIEIREVSGSSATFQVGGTYQVRGVCQQNSIQNASLYLGITVGGDGDGDAVKPVRGASLSKMVSKGRTEFDFAFTPLRPGKLHVTLYDVDNYNPKDNASEGLYLGDVTP